MQILSEREVAEVRRDGITVTKAALDLGRDHVSGVKLTVRSSVEEPVAIEIIEEVPGHVSLGEVQIHPSYGPRKWSKSEAHHRMEFRDEIPAAGSVVTIYGVRQSYEELDPFLDEPSITSVEPADHGTVGGDAIDLENVDLDADGDADPSPAGGNPSADAAGEESAAESARQADTRPVAEGETPSDRDVPRADPAPDQDQAAPDGDGAGSGAPDPGPVTDRPEPPASQFEFGEDRQPVTEPTVGEVDHPTGSEPDEAGRPSVGDPSGQPASSRDSASGPDEPSSSHDAALRVQLDHLQSTVAKLSAFADEFEAFVGEEGAPAAVVTELRAEQQELVEAVESLTERVDANADERAALEDQVNQLEATLDDLRASHESRISSLTDRIEELESTFTADETQAIREVIAAERAWRQHRGDHESPRMTVALGQGER